MSYPRKKVVQDDFWGRTVCRFRTDEVLIIEGKECKDYVHMYVAIPPSPDKPEKLFLFSSLCVILKKEGVLTC